MTLLEMLNQDLNLVGKVFRVCGESASDTFDQGQWGQILSRSRDGMYTVEIRSEDPFDEHSVTLLEMADWQFHTKQAWKGYVIYLNKSWYDLCAAANKEWAELCDAAVEAGDEQLKSVIAPSGRVLVPCPASNRCHEFLRAHPEFESLNVHNNYGAGRGRRSTHRADHTGGEMKTTKKPEWSYPCGHCNPNCDPNGNGHDCEAPACVLDGLAYGIHHEMFTTHRCACDCPDDFEACSRMQSIHGHLLSTLKHYEDLVRERKKAKAA